MITLIPFAILIAIFVIYIGGILQKYGVLTSVSQSYLDLPKDRRWIFSTWTIIEGMLLLFVVVPIEHRPLLVLCVASVTAGLACVGLAAQFKDKFQKILHVGGAILAVIGAVGFTFLQHNYILLITAPLLGLIISFIKLKNITYWMELSVFIMALLSIGILITKTVVCPW